MTETRYTYTTQPKPTHTDTHGTGESRLALQVALPHVYTVLLVPRQYVRYWGSADRVDAIKVPHG